MNALRDQRTRLATSAVSQATSLATARTLLLKVLDVAVEDSNLVVDPRSATRYVAQEGFAEAVLTSRLNSAQRSDTSLVTAQRLVDTVEDSVATRATVAAVDSVVDVEDKPVTLAVATDTCLVRSASLFFYYSI